MKKQKRVEHIKKESPGTQAPDEWQGQKRNTKDRSCETVSTTRKITHLIAKREREKEKNLGKRKDKNYIVSCMAHLTRSEFLIKRNLPLRLKVKMAKGKLQNFHHLTHGEMYVSYSGGKDSMVVLELARELFPETPAVFFHTGLEWPEIVKNIRNTPNCEIQHARISVREVIAKYGYPVVSKEQAGYIERIRKTHSATALYNYTERGRYSLSKKWKFLVKAPFKISDSCCQHLKKGPARIFEQRTGLKPILGLKADDSERRLHNYLQRGCIHVGKKTTICNPISIWTDEDCWNFIKERKLKPPSIYEDGNLSSTGCMYCMFGPFQDVIRKYSLLLKKHPKIFNYCYNKLGCGKVLKFIGERINENWDPTLQSKNQTTI